MTLPVAVPSYTAQTVASRAKENGVRYRTPLGNIPMAKTAYLPFFAAFLAFFAIAHCLLFSYPQARTALNIIRARLARTFYTGTARVCQEIL